LGTRDRELEERVSPRFPARVAVRYLAEGVDGRGTLEDISATGARIGEASPRLAAGAALRLRIANAPGLAMELHGRVVRETEGGFAVEFSHVDEQLRSLLRFLTHRPEALSTVETIMARKVVSVDPDCRITEVVSKLRGFLISCVVVCEEGVPVGIISERDIVGLAFTLLSGRKESRTLARELMSSSVTTVRCTDSLNDAVAVAARERIRHLPVVDEDGHLVGLVTQSDLLRAAMREIDQLQLDHGL
jgi:CBS domain-containing protein